MPRAGMTSPRRNRLSGFSTLAMAAYLAAVSPPPDFGVGISLGSLIGLPVAGRAVLRWMGVASVVQLVSSQFIWVRQEGLPLPGAFP
ncbi:hypothetical protein D3C78_1562390 [compost metagenome]